jgi:hypothetical protein
MSDKESDEDDDGFIKIKNLFCGQNIFCMQKSRLPLKPCHSLELMKEEQE